jgi:two-component system nitrogen regulation response regulator GlnG
MDGESGAGQKTTHKILVVEDCQETCGMIQSVCEREGWAAAFAATGELALAKIRASADEFDLVALDLGLPGMDGLDVLRSCRSLEPTLPIVMLTGCHDAATAVQCMTAGAQDYIMKPFPLPDLVRRFRKALETRKGLLRQLVQAKPDEYLASMMGPSEEVRHLAALVAQVSPTDMSVLIEGESGVGKELIAQRIHALSRRHLGPFIAVDSGAIPETLIEGELFGFKKGAFTGAYADRQGKVQAADAGTLLLDELENLPLFVQVKLLRVLQEKRVTPIGCTQAIPVNSRLVGTSNCPLRERITQKTFRKDLFFRIAEFQIWIPPLRERMEDLLHLCLRFLREAREEFGKQVEGFSEEALEEVLTYPWPGNARELRSVIRRAVLLHPGGSELRFSGGLSASGRSRPHPGVSVMEMDDKIVIRAHAVVGRKAIQAQQVPFKEIVKDLARGVEHGLMDSVLRQAGGNKSRAAKILHLDYKTVHTKAKAMGNCGEAST